MIRGAQIRGDQSRGDQSRGARPIWLSFVCLALVTALSGCGVGQSVLGIHDAPKPVTTSAALTVDQARRILTRTFTAVHQGETMTGAAAVTATKTAYTGEALRAARAQTRLSSVQPTLNDSTLLTVQQPQLLALSRGFGFPRFIVAQTLAAKGGAPFVYLLTSPDAATPYRISVFAEMVQLAKVKPFDPPGRGSPPVTDGKGLPVAPSALLNSYAALMAFPAKSATRVLFAADSFSPQVRSSAAGVAKAVAHQATFTQVHKVVTGSSYAVRQASGDALVFGVLERKDSFAVKSTQAVNTSANKAFVLLTGKKKVAKSASLTTLEFVVFAVPRSAGRATLVAAREQLVAGSGS